MLKEILGVIGVVVGGGLLITGVLYLVFKKNLTMRLWLGLFPGIALLVVNTYIWTLLGGIHNIAMMLCLVPFGMLLLIASFIYVGKTLMKKIGSAVSVMNDAALQGAKVASQISEASQSLAEGATEQAAGLEETSSSLEEMTSMTQQSATSAQQANVLAGTARAAAADGSAAMGKMSAAILDIQTSSAETAKIIKVIDEIAFQTNLLALNAAVEAARAGESGKGFAVVAEEVRNLAKRSAEAARNTAALIEGSVKNAQNGVHISEEVGQALTTIVENVSKTSELVSEISVAADEQAQGVGQINTAVSQMDQVTQTNAANAEESASASEELSHQAVKMNEIVADLLFLISGQRDTLSSVVAADPVSRPQSRPGPRPEARLEIPFDEDLSDFNA